MKRSSADILFSKLVREAGGYRCARCGKQYLHNDSGLHCSHHFTRSRKRTRYTPLNALALCFPCHQWYGGNPIESAAWLAEYLVPEKMAELQAMQRETIHTDKNFVKNVTAVLKEHGLVDPIPILRQKGLL
jgi:DNA-directed RNA polymerase subunit RPC12/RpoP